MVIETTAPNIERLTGAGLSAKVTISPPKVETFKSDNPVVSVTTGGVTDIYELIAKIESILNHFFTNQKSNF
jgi:hypothetical protein